MTTPTIKELVDLFDTITYLCIDKVFEDNLRGERVWDFSKSVLTITALVQKMASAKIKANAFNVRKEWTDKVKGYVLASDNVLSVTDDFKENFMAVFRSYKKLRSENFITDSMLVDMIIAQAGKITVTDTKDADLQNLKLMTKFQQIIPHLVKVKEMMTDELLVKLQNFYTTQPGCFRKEKDLRPKYHLDPLHPSVIDLPEFNKILRVVLDTIKPNIYKFFLTEDKVEVLPTINPVLEQVGIKVFGKVYKDEPYYYFNLGNFSIPLYAGGAKFNAQLTEAASKQV